MRTVGIHVHQTELRKIRCSRLFCKPFSELLLEVVISSGQNIVLVFGQPVFHNLGKITRSPSSFLIYDTLSLEIPTQEDFACPMI